MSSEDDDDRGGSGVAVGPNRPPSVNRHAPPPHSSSPEYHDAPPSPPAYNIAPMDDEGDDAPLPPDTMAASHETEPKKKPAFVDKGEEAEDEDIDAPPPPEMMAAYFERGNSYKEEKRVVEDDYDDDDEEAPLPPEMIAASYEGIDAVDHREAREKAPEMIRVLEERLAPSSGAEEEVRIKQEIGRLHEIDNDRTSTTINDRGGHIDPSLLLDRTHYTATDERDGASTNISTQRGRGNETSLAASSRGQMETPIHTTDEGMLSPSRPRLSVDPKDRSLPLLEATLVQDVPNEPVYIYINSNSREDEPVYDAVPVRRGCWSRHNKKAVVLGSVLVAIAAIVTVVVATAGRRKEPPVSENNR
jgi:hypothetical protein